MDQHRLRILFAKYMDRQSNSSELKELVMLLQEADAEDILTEPMQILWEEMKHDTKQYPADWEQVYKNIMQAGTTEKKSAKILSIQKFWWVAASIVLVLGVGAFLLLNKNPKNQLAVEKPSQIKMDIAPPNSPHAIITIASGKKIILDSAQNGSLAKQGNVNLVKLADGKLVYSQTPGVSSPEITYNTITVPRGSQVVSLTLADGTMVWLNAATSMRYPTVFFGKERKVEITGEAYFEVTKNPSMPFKVNVAGKGEVEVLGTHFNINSYSDEPTINTTLLEGSVKVTSFTTDDLQFIMPGQQARLNSKGQIELNKSPDIEEVMAWKNGKFQFGEKMDVQAIMRQLARWYDVEVEYKGTVNGFIGGSISRNVNISSVLSMLEKTGEVRFRIEGNKVTVLP